MGYINGPIDVTQIREAPCRFISVNLIDAKTAQLEDQVREHFSERAVGDVLEPSLSEEGIILLVYHSSQRM